MFASDDKGRHRYGITFSVINAFDCCLLLVDKHVTIFRHVYHMFVLDPVDRKDNNRNAVSLNTIRTSRAFLCTFVLIINSCVNKPPNRA